MLLFIIFCFITPVFVYLNWRLGSGWVDGLLIALPLLLIATFPFKRLLRVQRQLIYICLGVITYLTLLTVGRDVFELATEIQLPRWYVLAVTMVLVAGGMLHSYLGPHVKKVRIKIANLPEDLVGFRIVQMSDLHAGPSVDRTYIAKAVKKAAALNADVLVFTGDIGDGPPKIYGPSLDEFKIFPTRYGMYYVSGNHEHYWGVKDWEAVMTSLGAQVLHNTAKFINVKSAIVQIAGIPDPVSRVVHDFEALKGNADFKLLLSHRPGVAHEAAANGFHLQLSGHTHGGQFFPWTWVVRFVHEFDRGLKRVSDMWVYVNVGTGHWGPALRLGTTAEITLLELGH